MSTVEEFSEKIDPMIIPSTEGIETSSVQITSGDADTDADADTKNSNKEEENKKTSEKIDTDE